MRTKSDNKNKKRPLVILLAAFLVVAAAVGAYAYWTSGGSGTGTAETGESEAIEVIQTSTVEGMGPGVAAQTLTGNFNNDNDNDVYVGSVTAELASVDLAGCTVDDYVITDSPMVVDDEVASGDGEGAWTGAQIAFVNDPVRNQNACQGAVVTITYAVDSTPPA